MSLVALNRPGLSRPSLARPQLKRVGATADAGPGPEEALLEFYASTYATSDYEALVLKTGTTPATTPHTSDILARNVDGFYDTYENGEAVWEDGRFVRNEATYSADLTNAAWAKTNGTATATVFTATSANATCLQTITAASAPRIYSCKVIRVTGTGTIELTTDGGTTWTDVTSAVTGAAKRFTVNKGAVTNPQFGIRLVTSGDEVTFTEHQNEDATGRSDTTTPAEYIPTTTTAVTKVYQNENGNTVASNVVTEATGTALTVQPKLVAQDAGTNYFFHSDDMGDAFWAKVGITVTELSSAPSGALMNKLAASATGNEYINSGAIPSIPLAQHAMVSVVVEPGDINYCDVLIKGTGEASGTNKGVFVDIVNGTISAPLFGGYILPAVYGIEKLADNRYRVWIQLETDHDGAISNTFIMPSNNPSTLTMTSGEYIYATKANVTDTDHLIGPIITTTTAASSTALPPTFPAANHSDSKGPYVLNFKSTGADQDILLLGGTAFLKIEDGGVGSELLTNGTFDTDITSWAETVPTVSWEATGRIKVNNDTALYNSATQAVSGLTIGETYYLYAEYDSPVSGGVQPKLGVSGKAATLGTAGTEGALGNIFIATATSHTVALINNQNTVDGHIFWDNVSLKTLGKLLTLTDQTNKVSTAVTAADDHQAAVCFDATGLQMSLRLNAGSWNDQTYDGSPGSGDLTFGVPTSEVMRYDIDTGLAAQKTQADEDMA